MPDFSKYSGFLFDCDGTIADSMPAHLEAWNEALGKWGGHITKEQNDKWAGQPTKKIVARLNEHLGKDMPAEQIAHDKEVAFLKKIDTVGAIPAVLDVIKTFKGKKPMAVVSGGARDSVIKTLKHLGLFEFFPVIVGAEDYEKGKPAPDCFLKAASRLGVSADKCLVFEDADLGIEGAKRAGMAFIRVTAEGFDLSKSRL